MYVFCERKAELVEIEMNKKLQMMMMVMMIMMTTVTMMMLAMLIMMWVLKMFGKANDCINQQTKRATQR